MTQNPDNDGSYTVEVFTWGEDEDVITEDDVLVGLIGVAAFGEDILFEDDNFIL